MVQRWLPKTAVMLALLLPSSDSVAFTAQQQEPASAEHAVVYEKSMPGALDRCVVISSAQFAPQGLRSLSQSFLARHSGLALSRLLVVTKKTDAGLIQSGKGAYDLDFGQWIRGFEEQRRMHFPVAEIIQIGSSAVLRVRWMDGRLERIVLRGDDFLEQRIGGAKISMRWIYFSYAPLLKKTSLHVFVQSEHPLSEVIAKDVAARFREGMKVAPVSFTIRSDPWFSDDDFYPFVNPFSPVPPAPSYEEYLASKAFFCTSGRRSAKPSCTRYDGPLHARPLHSR